jgi:hypothetical protein
MGDNLPGVSETAPPKPEQNSSSMQVEKTESNGDAPGGDEASSSSNPKKRTQSQSEEDGSHGALKRQKGVAPIKTECDICSYPNNLHGILTRTGTCSIPTAIWLQKPLVGLAMMMQPKLRMTDTTRQQTPATAEASRAGKIRKKIRSRNRRVKTRVAHLAFPTIRFDYATPVLFLMSFLPPNVLLGTDVSLSMTCASI